MWRKLAVRGILLGVSSAASMSPALAQSAEPGATGPATQHEGDTSPPISSDSEIIVTAQKRSERQLDVPSSVAVLSGESLQSLGVTSSTDLQQVVPGLRMTSAGAYTQPSIRGITSDVTGAGATANVATYIDGLYQPFNAGADLDLIDIRDVQVLKGPQGTLFGRNATAGAILLTTRDPGNDASYLARLSAGNRDTFGGVLSATIPLSEAWSSSIILSGDRSNGFNRDVITGKRADRSKEFTARAKLRWNPNSDTDFVLEVGHRYEDDPSSFVTNAYHGEATATLLGAVVPSDRGDVANNFAPVFTARSTNASLRGKVDLGTVQLTTLTQYQRRNTQECLDVDASALPLLGACFPLNEQVFTQEFNLGNSGPRLTWVTGIFFLRQTGQTSLQFIDPPLGQLNRVNVGITSIAGFADATYKLSDSLFATAGVRVGHDQLSKKDLDPVGGFKAPGKGFTATDARFALRYEMAPDTNIYATVSKGSKSGLFNANDTSTVPADPEKIVAYEGGIKLKRGSFTFNVAGFHYDYSDLQVISYKGIGTLLLNAAKARVNGAEFNMSLQPIEGLSVGVGGGYTDAKYASFPTAPHTQFIPGQGIVVINESASGNQLQRTPKFSGNANFDYRTHVSSGTLRLSGNASYQNRIYFDPFEDTNQPSYVVVNGRVSWSSENDRYTIAAYGKNLTDKKYIVGIVQQPVAILQRYAQPLSAGLEFTLRY